MKRAGSKSVIPPEPLLVAVKRGNVEEIKRAIRRNAGLLEVDDDNQNSLHILAKITDDWVPAIVDSLVKKKLNINEVDKAGNTPILLAAQNQNFKVCRVLIDSEEMVCDVSGVFEGGKTILHYILSGSPLPDQAESYTALLESLYSKGVNLEAPTTSGETPLFAAANSGNCVGLRSLLKKKININHQNKSGHTALYSAVKLRQEHTGAILIEEGVDYDILTYTGDSPLELAKARQLNVFAYLLEETPANIPPPVRAYYFNREDKVIIVQKSIRCFLVKNRLKSPDAGQKLRSSTIASSCDDKEDDVSSAKPKQPESDELEFTKRTSRADTELGKKGGLRKIKRLVDKSNLQKRFSSTDSKDSRKSMTEKSSTPSSTPPPSVASNTLSTPTLSSSSLTSTAPPTITTPTVGSLSSPSPLGQSLQISMTPLTPSSATSNSSTPYPLSPPLTPSLQSSSMINPGTAESESGRAAIRFIQIPRADAEEEPESVVKRTRRNSVIKVGEEFESNSTLRQLQLTVSEAKNLKDALTDGYCEINVGGAQVRTKTAWGKREDPYWGEDIQLQLNQLYPISVTVCEGSHKLVGQVTIPVEFFTEKESHEQTFPLSSVKREEYVSGDIHLKLEFRPSSGSLFVKVLEGRSLAPKNASGLSDSFLRLNFGKEVKKTKVFKRSLQPQWNQDFEFAISSSGDPLILSVWNNDLMGLHNFMGQVVIDLSSLEPNTLIESWYVLQTRDNDEPSKKLEKLTSTESSIGEIRIRWKYSEQTILSVTEYEPLLQFLLEDSLGLVKWLGGIIKTEREETAKSLVKIFSSRYKVSTLIHSIIGSEVERMSTPETIFRGNTLGTKIVDMFLKEIGLEYLSSTLEPVVREICAYKKSCEVDPTKIDKAENVAKNFKQLLYFVEKTVTAIFASTENCPWHMRKIFNFLQRKIEDKFSKDGVRYTAVSSFLFLRFFGPAILSPKQFDIVDEYPDETTIRTLTLVSKTIQNLANLVQFGHKEEYMKDMNEFIIENLDNMKKFIDKVSDPPAFAPDIAREVSSPNVQRYYAYIHNLLAAYKPHLDDQDPKFSKRFLSVLYQLNEKRDEKQHIDRQNQADVLLNMKLKDCRRLYSFLLDAEIYFSRETDTSISSSPGSGSLGPSSGGSVASSIASSTPSSLPQTGSTSSAATPSLPTSAGTNTTTSSSSTPSISAQPRSGNQAYLLTSLSTRLEYLLKYVIPILDETLARTENEATRSSVSVGQNSDLQAILSSLPVQETPGSRNSLPLASSTPTTNTSSGSNPVAPSSTTASPSSSSSSTAPLSTSSGTPSSGSSSPATTGGSLSNSASSGGSSSGNGSGSRKSGGTGRTGSTGNRTGSKSSGKAKPGTISGTSSFSSSTTSPSTTSSSGSSTSTASTAPSTASTSTSASATTSAAATSAATPASSSTTQSTAIPNNNASGGNGNGSGSGSGSGSGVVTGSGSGSGSQEECSSSSSSSSSSSEGKGKESGLAREQSGGRLIKQVHTKHDSAKASSPLVRTASEGKNLLNSTH